MYPPSMTLLTKATYCLASLGVVFHTFLGAWFYAFHEFPPAMVEEMKKSADGREIFKQLWGGLSSPIGLSLDLI